MLYKAFDLLSPFENHLYISTKEEMKFGKNSQTARNFLLLQTLDGNKSHAYLFLKKIKYCPSLRPATAECECALDYIILERSD